MFFFHQMSGSVAWRKVGRILSVRTRFRDYKSMVAVVRQTDTGQTIEEKRFRQCRGTIGSLSVERQQWLDIVLAKAEYLPLGLDGLPAQWKSFVQLVVVLMNFKLYSRPVIVSRSAAMFTKGFFAPRQASMEIRTSSPSWSSSMVSASFVVRRMALGSSTCWTDSIQ